MQFFRLHHLYGVVGRGSNHPKITASTGKQQHDSNARLLAAASMKHCQLQLKCNNNGRGSNKKIRPRHIRDVVGRGSNHLRNNNGHGSNAVFWPGHRSDVVGRSSIHLRNNNEREIYKITTSTLYGVVGRRSNTTLSAAASMKQQRPRLQYNIIRHCIYVVIYGIV